MSPDQNSIGVRIFLHRLLQASRQVFLERSVLDNRDTERIVEAQHALPPATWDALDLLDVVNLKASSRALHPLDQERHQHCPLRVRVDGAEGSALKRSQEQRGAVGGLQRERLADVFALRGRVLGRGPLQHKNVLGFHQFLLDARRRDEDVIVLTD